MEKLLIGGVILYLLWKETKKETVVANVQTEKPDDFKTAKDQIAVDEKNTSTMPSKQPVVETVIVKEAT